MSLPLPPRPAAAGLDVGAGARLPGGGEISVHPLGPGAGDLLQEGLSKMSPESRRRRFHTPLKQFSPGLLRRLTAIDGLHHRAWGVYLDDHPVHTGIGVARLVEHADRPDLADLAITVLDRFQGRGVGRLLLDFLIAEGRRAGYRALTAAVLADNGPMLHLLESVGAVRTAQSQGQIELQIPLRPVS